MGIVNKINLMKFYSLIPLALVLFAGNNQFAVEAVKLDKKAMGPNDQYLTKVFHKWDQNGLDADGVPNGKRVLTKDNAERAAREVAGKWKGLKGMEAVDWVESRFGAAWHDFGAGDFIDVRDAYFRLDSLSIPMARTLPEHHTVPPPTCYHTLENKYLR